jgi:hypothetical protein
MNKLTKPKAQTLRGILIGEGWGEGVGEEGMSIGFSNVATDASTLHQS